MTREWSGQYRILHEADLRDYLASLPELADLSTRQWEIVTRLVQGDRVPAIARSMFLSQNTVRNYLAAVYRRLGVHSQQELIERLRGRSDGSSG